MRPIEHERCREAFVKLLSDNMPEHDNNIWKTLIWANNKLNAMSSGNVSDENHYLVQIAHELKAWEINQVIHELTTESELHIDQ